MEKRERKIIPRDFILSARRRAISIIIIYTVMQMISSRPATKSFAPPAVRYASALRKPVEYLVSRRYFSRLSLGIPLSLSLSLANQIAR